MRRGLAVLTHHLESGSLLCCVERRCSRFSGGRGVLNVPALKPLQTTAAGRTWRHAPARPNRSHKKPRGLTSSAPRRILCAMDRFSYSSLRSLRNVRPSRSPYSYPEVVPFAPRGAGQWTGGAIGWFIVVGFFLIALVGVPESWFFLLIVLSLSALLAFALRLLHRSKSAF
jgi:hypothetical protein